MEALVMILWLAGVITQIAIAIALYHMAEQRYGSGALWALAGMVFGPLALVGYFAFVFFEASLAHTKALEEHQRIQAIMDLHVAEQPPPDAGEPGFVHHDPHIEQLLAGGRTAEAAQYARERLFIAHEQGSVEREELYRRYLKELEQGDSRQ